jgi:hypothetical protein
MDGGSGTLTLTAPGNVIIPTGLNVSSLSTFLVDADTVSTSKLDLDGQVLTANPTELLLNGIPLATTSNLSSIADWSLDPAISTVQMAGFGINNVPDITGYNDLLLLRASTVGPNLTLGYDSLNPVSSQFIFDTTGGPLMRYRAGNLDVSSITASNITTVTFTALSTVNVVSTISSLVLEGNLIQTSTLFANAFLSTPDIEVSTINGAAFGASSITVDVVGVSSLVANSISSAGAVLREALVSTLQFNPSFSLGGINLGLGSLFGNLGGAALGVMSMTVAGAALGTGVAALHQTRVTSNINSNSYELVNGTTQLQISTLGTSFSTVYRFVSSVADNVPGEEYFVSSIHGPGVAIRSLSDPLNTVSAPTSTIQSFGQWVALDANLPIPSSVSTYQQLFTSSLGVSTINMNNGTQFQRGANFQNLPSGVSTTELFWYEASPPLDANLRLGGIILSGDDVGGLNFSKDVLIQNQNNGNRISVFPGSSTIAYLQDIPSTTSTFSQLFTSSLAASSITMEGQIFINPSTTRSGIYMPFDAVNGTGVVAVGLSTGSVFNQYSALLAGVGTPYNSTSTEMFTLLQTKDNEASFQFAPLSLGTVLFNGEVNYGTNAVGYITGDVAGNLYAGAAKFQTSTLVAPSTLTSSLTVSSINNAPYLPFRGGQFYRSSNQNLPTGNNNLIFDTAKPWNSADFVQTDPSTFVCSTTGTYQIQVNNTIIAATGVWTNLGKFITINQDRGGSALNVVANSTSIPAATNYGQAAFGLIDIDQGDLLRFVTGQSLTSGSTISAGLSNVFDLNTFWDYQLLRTG